MKEEQEEQEEQQGKWDKGLTFDGMDQMFGNMKEFLTLLETHYTEKRNELIRIQNANRSKIK